MDAAGVKAHIRDGKFDKFYIFTGDEVEVQRIYINEIIKRSGTKANRADSVAEIATKLNSKSIFQVPTCYVIRNDSEFVKNEKAWQKIEELLGVNMIILQLTSVDKRGKFYKHFKDKIVEFDHLSDEMLQKYIKKEIPLSAANCQRLIEVCERDYSRILLEIDKIKSFVRFLPASNYDRTFEQFLEDGTIYQPPQDVVFDWVSAIMEYRVSDAFSFYENCKRKQVSSLAMISLLYTAIKQQMQVQDALNNGRDIANTTGLTAYQIKIAQQRKGVYSIGDLVYMLGETRGAEVGIKSGKIDEEWAVLELMIKILA